MSDYYQGIVAEFLQNDRGVFVNPEILLQLDPGAPVKGRYWYCDLMAVSLSKKEVFLCEVTYASDVSSLIKRLHAWQNHWPALKHALQRDCAVDATWSVSPWVFIPEKLFSIYKRRMAKIAGPIPSCMPVPKLTALEDVVPWK